jgi:hypothetical protein
MRIENARDLIEVDLAAYEATLETILSFRRSNPDASSRDVRAAVAGFVETLAGQSLATPHLVMLAVLADPTLVLSGDDRKWLVHHFWEQIPEDTRRGARPAARVDFEVAEVPR